MMNSRWKFFTIVFVLALLSSLLACTPGTATLNTLTQISVQLRWTHQAQFAGLYAADQNGYFKNEGLQVTFLEGGPQDVLQPVADGKAHFGIAGADELILARAKGVKFTAIATIYRRSPVVFFSLAEAGITRPDQFAGKKIRVTTNSIPSLHAMTARVGLGPEQYSEVILPSEVNLFAGGEVPVWSGYLDGIVLTVQESGYDINIIYPDDYGVHFYADTIYTTDSLLADHPDLALRFLRAALAGWTYAVENPSLIGAIVAAYNPKADAALENKRMLVQLPMVNTGEDQIGWMKAEIWAGMAKTLSDQGLLANPLDVTEVYTMRFLEELYQK